MTRIRIWNSDQDVDQDQGKDQFQNQDQNKCQEEDLKSGSRTGQGLNKVPFKGRKWVRKSKPPIYA